MKKHFDILVLYWLVALFLEYKTSAVKVHGHFTLREEGMPIKKDVLCPNSCLKKDSHEEVRRCCACQSNPVWELSPSSFLTPVDFERYDILGRNQIIHDKMSDNNTYLTFQHRRAFLTVLPENICDIKDSLVVIDVSYNSLSEIGHINCLWRLDTLILSYNKLRLVSNTTFQNMSSLRIVDMSHNRIKTMDPGLFHGASRSIYHVDLSYNIFNKMDVSNVLFPNATFCTLNYSNAIFGDFTNLFNTTLTENERVGCGNVVFDNCLLHETHLAVIFDLIDHQYSRALKYHILGRFTYNNVSISCDCKLGELFVAFGFVDFFNMYKKDEISRYTCVTPDRMKGINLVDVNNYHILDKFVCNKSVYCPENCTCLEQPSQNRFVVNCSFQSHSSLPARLPLTKYPYYLDFTSNHITHLVQTDYTPQISHLLLDGNEVQDMDSTFVRSLNDLQMMTLNEHDLRSLPKAIEKIGANRIIFGRNSIPCDCTSEWIAKWRRYSKADPLGNPLFCRNPTIGIKHIEETMNYLDCSKHSSYYQIPILITLAFLLTAFSIFLFFFAEELRILKCRIAKSRRKSVGNEIKHDVFISFDENSLETRNFVMRYLRSYLINEGYSVIVPCIQLSVGGPREKETENIMKETKSVLIVLTENYGKNEEYPWTTLEYKRAIQMYLNIADVNIILLNFEGLKISNTSLPYLKALRRVNGCLHMTDRKRSIYACVKEKCGPPIVKKNNPQIFGIRNRRQRMPVIDGLNVDNGRDIK